MRQRSRTLFTSQETRRIQGNFLRSSKPWTFLPVPRLGESCQLTALLVFNIIWQRKLYNDYTTLHQYDEFHINHARSSKDINIYTKNCKIYQFKVGTTEVIGTGSRSSCRYGLQKCFPPIYLNDSKINTAFAALSKRSPFHTQVVIKVCGRNGF